MEKGLPGGGRPVGGGRQGKWAGPAAKRKPPPAKQKQTGAAATS